MCRRSRILPALLTSPHDDGIVVVMAGETFLTDRPMTTLAYLRGPETTRPLELVFGVVREPAAPSWAHQDVVARLLLLLREHVDAHGLGQLVPAPVDVVLDAERHLVVQPDICFVADQHRGIIRGRVWGAPDLVVEVLSYGSRTYDCRRKLTWYRQYGVREYWVVDPVAREIIVNDFASDARRTYGAHQSIRTPILPRLRFKVARVFPERAEDSKPCHTADAGARPPTARRSSSSRPSC
jgi:Uma2 family endonuclease